MGKLDNVRRIIKEDFKSEDQELIGKLAYVINSFMEQVVRQFNGNIDFTNLSEDVVQYTVTVDGSGVPIGNNLVKSTVNNPKGVVVVKAENKTSSTTYPTSAPWVSWTPNGNILKIQKITGLQANNKYVLTLRVIP